jgi:hypothetical protein
MKSDPKDDLTKITVNLFAPMYRSFDRQLSDALLRRDAFIDRMIATEIPHLREDLTGKALSRKANRHISQSLKGMGTELLAKTCISIRPSTAKALHEAVNDHNLVRDAFINRLIALLRSSDDLLGLLDLPTRITSSRRDGTEDMPTSPLKAIDEIQSDPLFYLRHACQHRHECGLYDLELPPHLHGLSCYLPDEVVPGTAEYAKKVQRDMSTYVSLADLGDFEPGLPSITSKSV